MTEPEPILTNDNQPLTKREFRELKTDVGVLKTEVSEIRTDLDDLAEATRKGFEATATKKDLKQFVTKEDMKQYATKEDVQAILTEFKVLAENIHRDVAAANKDEISLIKDQQLPDHEERIQDLEKYTELPVGPRHATPV